LINSNKLNYSRPPITEAIIQVIVNHEMDLDDMEKVAKQLHKTYPNQKTIDNFQIHLNPQMAKNGNVAVDSKSIGFQLSSGYETDIVSISQNALAVARLAPYLGWDALHKQFVTAWKSWKKVAKTKAISRIGVRYVNRIDIPFKGEDKIDLEDYLTFCPKVPELGNFPMTEYLIQVTQPITTQWSATITSRGLPSPLVNHVSLLLDIDVFRINDIPLKDNDLWSVIDEAHAIKNTVFQSCITQKTEELFK
jgi:uncharacterized protein (TIGR04255 family)